MLYLFKTTPSCSRNMRAIKSRSNATTELRLERTLSEIELPVGDSARMRFRALPTSSSKDNASPYSSTGASGTDAPSAATYPRQIDRTGARSLPATNSATHRSKEPCAQMEYESCAYGNAGCATNQAPASRDCFILLGRTPSPGT